MSYQFYNNWPYSASVFPTMVDHVDPVNQTYFSGLHQEVETIEGYIGLLPEGSHGTVRARLDAKDSQNTTDEGNLSTHVANKSNPHEVSLEQARTKNNQISGAIDINKQVLSNIVIDRGTSEPGSPVAGQMFFRTDTKVMKVYDGVTWINLSGSGKMTAIMLNPDEGTLPSSDYPTIAKITSGFTDYYVAQFPDATEKYFCFVKPIPSRTTSGNIKITFYGRCNATAGNAYFLSSLWTVNDDAPWDFSGASVWNEFFTIGAKATANDLIVVTVNSSVPSFVEGKAFLLKVKRLGTDDLDTLAATFELIGIKIEEV